ncbi:MAG: glycosyltransferase family 39 protein [Deltaproteobacteria bacterium]|nr:glycosyltransferase family 39 protein [Deltaproteobacteria bacterium]
MKRALVLALLFLLAAAYMRLALFIPVSWTDEGVLVYPIWRVAEGELPYRDFQQMYGPSLFFLGGLVFRIFGSDLAVLRYLLLGVKAATCVMVYLGARRISGRPFAYIAYALAVVLAGLIWPVSSVPYASFFGTALCLAGLLSFLALERRFLLGCAVAGLCFGLAATFKQTTGAFAFLALALYLLLEDGKWRGRPSAIFAIAIRTSRWFVLLFAAAVAILYLAPRNPFWNLVLLLSPALFLIGHLALRELRRGSDPESELRSFWGTVTLSLAFLAPLSGYAIFYLSLGLGDEILFNTVTGIPSAVAWISPFPIPTANFVLWQLSCLGGFASAAIWRHRSTTTLRGFRLWAFAGLVTLSLLSFAALAAKGWQARGEDWWFWGSSDLLFGVPFVVVWLSLAGVVRLGPVDETNRTTSRRRSFLLFACYAPMSLLWLYPAADIWHILAVLPSCLPLLATLLERFWQLPGADGQNARSWQIARSGLIGSFCIALALPSVRDVLRERGEKPGFEQPLARATGVRGGSGLYSPTRNAGKLVRYLNQQERRDEALFVLSGKHLFYFLTDRVSPVQEFEYIFYLVGFDSLREERANELIDVDELLRRLGEVRPLIIDDDSDDHAENVRRMYPGLADFIITHYREEKQFGSFRLLRWDRDRASP